MARVRTRRRSLLLLEVVVGLALLGTLGVAALQLQAHALYQVRRAQEQAEVVQRVEALLWSWSAERVPVTLPATGSLTHRFHWRREVRPVRLAPDVLPTQVTVVVTAQAPGTAEREVYRVAWLVPEPGRERP
ncbi:MAG: hypothetical protein AB1716_16075 [Planctomycetota bacterium]